MLNGVSETDEFIKRNSTLFKMGSSFGSPSHSSRPEDGHFYNSEKFMKASSPLGPVDFSEKLDMLDPKPHPEEDIATTRSSDEYLSANGLGTHDHPSPGKDSTTATINAMLKEVPFNSTVENEKLIEFLEANKQLWGGENFALLLARKLYSLNLKANKEAKNIQSLKNGLEKEIRDSKGALTEEIKTCNNLLQEYKNKLDALENNVFGQFTKEDIDRSLFDEIFLFRACLGPLLSLPKEIENIKNELAKNSEPASSDLDDLQIKYHQLNIALPDLKDSILNTEEKVSKALAEVDELKSGRQDDFNSLKRSFQAGLAALESRVSAQNQNIDSLNRKAEKSEIRTSSLEQENLFLKEKIKNLEEPPSDNFLKFILFTIVVALFVAVVWVSSSSDKAAQTSSGNPYYSGSLENSAPNQYPTTGSFRDERQHPTQYPTIGTLNLPIQFKGKMEWDISYFSGGDDVKAHFQIKSSYRTYLSKEQLNLRQKEITKYLCSTPTTQEFLNKNLRFDCVIENWRNEKIRQFYVTREDCQ